MREPICHACGELCDCGEVPHEEKCSHCSLCMEMDEDELDHEMESEP